MKFKKKWTHGVTQKETLEVKKTSISFKIFIHFLSPKQPSAGGKNLTLIKRKAIINKIIKNFTSIHKLVQKHQMLIQVQNFSDLEKLY